MRLRRAALPPRHPLALLSCECRLDTKSCPCAWLPSRAGLLRPLPAPSCRPRPTLQAARPVQRAPAAAAGGGVRRIRGRAKQHHAAIRWRSGQRGGGGTCCASRRCRCRCRCCGCNDGRRPCVLCSDAQRCSSRLLGGAAGCGDTAGLAAATDCGPCLRQRRRRRQRQRRWHRPCHADRRQPWGCAQHVWCCWRWLGATDCACASCGATASARTPSRAICWRGG